jgi:putative transposase
MKEYRHGAHTIYEIHIHIVWVTKYRRAVLNGEVGLRWRDLLRDICRAEEVSVVKGHISKDHVHLMVSIPPHVAISKLVQKLRGKSVYKLCRRVSQAEKAVLGRTSVGKRILLSH